MIVHMALYRDGRRTPLNVEAGSVDEAVTVLLEHLAEDVHIAQAGTDAEVVFRAAARVKVDRLRAELDKAQQDLAALQGGGL